MIVLYRNSLIKISKCGINRLQQLKPVKKKLLEFRLEGITGLYCNPRLKETVMKAHWLAWAKLVGLRIVSTYSLLLPKQVQDDKYQCKLDGNERSVSRFLIDYTCKCNNLDNTPEKSSAVFSRKIYCEYFEGFLDNLEGLPCFFHIKENEPKNNTSIFLFLTIPT